MIIPGGRLLQTSSQWRLVFFGLALAALAAFQLFKLPPILPFLLQEYGYDRTLAGAFMSVYALAGLLFSVPLARLLQRQGAALPIKLALCAFAVSNLAIAFLPESGWAVLAARFLEGLAFAVLAVAGPSIANAHAGPRALPLVIGLTAAWIPIGQVVAAALAEPALNAGRWWWLPVGGLGLAALMLLASALLGAGVNFAKPGGGANGPAPTAEERFSLRLSATIFLIFSGQYFAYMTWLTQYLVEEMGLRFHDALIGYLVPVVTLMFWNVLAGLLLKERRRLGWLLQLGMGAMAFGWFVLPYVGTDFFGLASLVLYGIGGGLAPTCLFATPNAILGPGRPLVGAFGTLMTGRNIGVFFGPVVLAELTKGSGGWTLGAPLFGAVTLVGAFLAFWLTRRLAEDRARAA